MTDHVRGRDPRRLAKTVAVTAALTLSGTLLTACGDGSGKTTLTWYTNPDSGGQAQVAKNCSTDAYTIKTQTLPQDAGQQRIQLARRLAAQDSGIDLMSIDPPYTAEFANAGFLAKIPEDVQDRQKEQAFKGAVRRRHLGRQARGPAVLVQHPGAVVPQVLRREGRDRHDQACHLGPDHRCGRRERRQDRRCRPTSTKAIRSGSTPSYPGREATSSRTPRRASTRRSPSTPPRARTAAEGDQEARALRRPRRRPVDLPGGPGRHHLRLRPRARSW